MSEVTIELGEMLSQHKERLMKTVEDALFENLKNQLSWSAEAQVKEAVGEFVKKEIVPEIQAYLATHREEIVTQVLGGITECFGLVVGKMTETAVKNLASGYKLQSVMKELFNS
jgi:vacuolar-type H+-ATPase subunit E/Vma4